MSNHNKSFERTMKRWAKEWSEQNITPEVNILINQATFDVFHGPSGEDSEYPGFEHACEKIETTLKGLPAELYIDTDTESYNYTKPDDSEDCYDCDGSGDDNGNYPCQTCAGVGRLEAYTLSYVFVSKSEMLEAIVGKQLSKYIGV
jgi:hypothetical protein